MGRRRGGTGVVVLLTMLLVGLLCAGCGGESTSRTSSSEAQSRSSAAASSSPVTGAPESTAYVHLGDSYAAGTGVTPFVPDSPLLCQRSSLNFGHLVAQRRGLELTDVSCAGATTADLTAEQYYGVAPQLDALGPNTRLVTMTLGGNNDAVFGGSVSKCSAVAGAGTGSPCRDRYGDQLAAPIEETVYPALVAGLQAIAQRAPNARVLIVGYPWILPATGGCFPQMQIAEGDVGYLHALQAELNVAVERAAGAAGATFVDMAQVSQGHDACAGTARWVEPQRGTTARVTLHPNAAGQQAMAEQVLAALG